MVAIFCPFSQFCEINSFLLSLQTQPNTAPNLFQRGVEYGKYAIVMLVTIVTIVYTLSLRIFVIVIIIIITNASYYHVYSLHVLYSYVLSLLTRSWVIRGKYVIVIISSSSSSSSSCSSDIL